METSNSTQKLIPNRQIRIWSQQKTLDLSHFLSFSLNSSVILFIFEFGLVLALNLDNGSTESTLGSHFWPPVVTELGKRFEAWAWSTSRFEKNLPNCYKIG